MTDDEMAEYGRHHNGTSNVMNDVWRERVRQIESEGWTHEHDDAHDAGQMVAAACTYALETTFDGAAAKGRWFGMLWPWDRKWFKPKDRRRDLIRAAALIVAEIERLDRAAVPLCSCTSSTSERCPACAPFDEDEGDHRSGAQIVADMCAAGYLSQRQPKPFA